MSTERKPAGDAAMTQLKELWKRLDDVARDYWRSRLPSKDFSQSALRAELKTKFKIDLRSDGQLTRFRQWQEAWDAEQEELNQEAERKAADEARLHSEHPDWTKDQIRDGVIKSGYMRSWSRGDFKLGLAVMKQDRGFMEMYLDREKFAYLQKEDLEKALGALHSELKELPGGDQIYTRFESDIKAAREKAQK